MAYTRSYLLPSFKNSSMSQKQDSHLANMALLQKIYKSQKPQFYSRSSLRQKLQIVTETAACDSTRSPIPETTHISKTIIYIDKLNFLPKAMVQHAIYCRRPKTVVCSCNRSPTWQPWPYRRSSTNIRKSSSTAAEVTRDRNFRLCPTLQISPETLLVTWTIHVIQTRKRHITQKLQLKLINCNLLPKLYFNIAIMAYTKSYFGPPKTVVCLSNRSSTSQLWPYDRSSTNIRNRSSSPEAACGRNCRL